MNEKTKLLDEIKEFLIAYEAWYKRNQTATADSNPTDPPPPPPGPIKP